LEETRSLKRERLAEYSRKIAAEFCECLYRLIIRDEDRLRQVLKAYARYYNCARTHLGLNKDASFQINSDL
jgi:hypothetical protein